VILEREKGRRKLSMSEITRDEAFTLLKKYP
jgi:predicted hydrolase (HD superfamily)